MKFAKLFELENNEQVLLFYIYNDEDEEYEVSIRTDFKQCVAKITLAFDGEEETFRCIENYKEENAIAFRNDMEKLLID